MNDTNNVQTISQNVEEQKPLRFSQVFIGKKYDKITNNKFSFPGFFFGALYFMYRRMYLYGFILFIIQTVFSTVLSSFIDNLIVIIILQIVSAIIIGFLTNNLYIRHVKKKLEKIRRIANSYNEAYKLCEKKGGTRVSAVILFILLILVLCVIVVLLLAFSMVGVFFSMFTNPEINIEGSNQNNPQITPTEFNGILSYNTFVNLNDELSIEIPIGFEEGFMHDENSYEYEHTSIPYCEFNIHAMNDYGSSDILITQMADYYGATSEVDVISTNEYIYNTFKVGNIYYYSIANDDKVYLIEYQSNSVECDSYQEGVINSIKFK